MIGNVVAAAAWVQRCGGWTEAWAQFDRDMADRQARQHPPFEVGVMIVGAFGSRNAARALSVHTKHCCYNT